MVAKVETYRRPLYILLYKSHARHVPNAIIKSIWFRSVSYVHTRTMQKYVLWKIKRCLAGWAGWAGCVVYFSDVHLFLHECCYTYTTQLSSNHSATESTDPQYLLHFIGNKLNQKRKKKIERKRLTVWLDFTYASLTERSI